MNIDIHFLIPGTSSLTSDEILQSWRTHAPELASMEHTSIAKRAPEDTGTLIFSLTQEVNPSGDVLARIYTDPDTQLTGPWQRVYAQYQEGLPLGHTTYTRQTPHFIYAAQDQDAAQIQLWAITAGQIGVGTMVNAAEAAATEV